MDKIAFDFSLQAVANSSMVIMVIRSIMIVYYHFLFFEGFIVKNNIFLAMIQFMGSERGVRSSYWRVSAAAWGIKDLDKEKITIRDKLNDMKIMPFEILPLSY